MRAVLLHTELTADAAKDEADVLAQMDAIGQALYELNIQAERLPFTLNLQATAARLDAVKPDVVFNLVESVGRSGRLLPLAGMLLDHLGLPYTGGPTAALFLSTDKVLCKHQLQRAGLPTPAWALDGESELPPTVIIKPLWEDASVGIDAQAICHEQAEIAPTLQQRQELFGDCFVEAFIPGREFNVSVLASPAGPQVLPIAEMTFRNYPPDKPAIVDYRAKWDEASFEYQNTIRRFDFPREDDDLLQGLRELALQSWHELNCRGYARVDFRVGAENQPFILEINVNPCIAPDAGFVAAAQQAGLSYTDMIARILNDANPEMARM